MADATGADAAAPGAETVKTETPTPAAAETHAAAVSSAGSAASVPAAAPTPPAADAAASAPAAAVEAAPAGGTPYSASFTDIMKKVQAGEELPGIKQIEDKLSADAENPTESKMTQPPKPWEKKDTDAPVSKLPPNTVKKPEAEPVVKPEKDENGLRTALVDEAVKFMSNPKVSALTLNQKIEFLAAKKVGFGVSGILDYFPTCLFHRP
jgi:hypothetical protein